MTVAGEPQVALPRPCSRGNDRQEPRMRDMLDGVGCAVHLDDRVETLTRRPEAPARDRQGVRRRAEAADPRRADGARWAATRSPCCSAWSATRSAAGTAIVYITHRLAEVRELADRVTVLRDGTAARHRDRRRHHRRRAARAHRRAQLDSTFPDKHVADAERRATDFVRRRTRPGAGFADVSFAAATRGEIIGVAGVVGNGQSELLRALAGLEPFTGTRHASTARQLSRQQLLQPRRLHAGRPARRGSDDEPVGAGERRAVGAQEVPVGRVRSAAAARSSVVERCAQLASVKAPSMDATVSPPLRRQPAEGRDVPGAAVRAAARWSPTSPPRASTSARAPRSTGSCARSSTRGVPVVVASSDAKELEGLCDQVHRDVARPRRRDSCAATTSPRSGSSAPRSVDHPHREVARQAADRRAEAQARTRCAGSCRATTRRPCSCWS